MKALFKMHAGASILVECRDLQGKAWFKEAKTNWLGEFEVLLPFQVGRKVKSIRKCSVQLVNSSDTHCSTAPSSTIHSFKLKSRRQGVHYFSAGFFTFKPIELPRFCHQKPRPVTFSQVGPAKSWIPPILGSNPTIPDLPTIPHLQQIPDIPPLPTLNHVTNPPNGAKPSVSSLDSRTSKMTISLNAPLPFFRLPPITIGFDPYLAPPPPILHSDPLQPPFYNFPPGGSSKLPPPSFSFHVPPLASPEDDGPIHPRNSPVPTSKKMLP